jgi:hypothetical protein
VVRFPVARGAITEGIDEREVLPSHDCEVCSTEQRLKSGSATVARDWATRRSEPWDSKMDIPALRFWRTPLRS